MRAYDSVFKDRGRQGPPCRGVVNLVFHPGNVKSVSSTQKLFFSPLGSDERKVAQEDATRRKFSPVFPQGTPRNSNYF